jgi:nitric oxide reductase large subunit
LATMFNFILIASAGILTTLNPSNLRSKLKIIGVTVGLIGTLAVVGYCLNAPHLYYYIEGVNSAIACHTAALFIVLGIGFLCL